MTNDKLASARLTRCKPATSSVSNPSHRTAKTPPKGHSLVLGHITEQCVGVVEVEQIWFGLEEIHENAAP